MELCQPFVSVESSFVKNRLYSIKIYAENFDFIEIYKIFLLSVKTKVIVFPVIKVKCEF